MAWTIAIMVLASSMCSVFLDYERDLIELTCAGRLKFMGDREHFFLLCAARDRGVFPALYAPTVSIFSLTASYVLISYAQVAFETVMLILVLWGAYKRSSSSMESKSLISYLLHDGFVYILVCSQIFWTVHIE